MYRDLDIISITGEHLTTIGMANIYVHAIDPWVTVIKQIKVKWYIQN